MRSRLSPDQRVKRVPADYVCHEKAAIHSETETPDKPWTVERNGITYTLSMPFGATVSDGFLVTRDGVTLPAGWLYVPSVKCHPHPGKPIHPGGYAFWNPPLGIRVDDDNVQVDPAEALRQIVAEAVLPAAVNP